MKDRCGPITIITGEKGKGKSTLIRQLVYSLRNSGINPQGLISPGIYDSGKKIGISVENIATCARKQLAFYDPGWDSEMPERVWRFDTQALKWGNNVLNNIKDTCEVMVVDEIGYLELEKDEGWHSIFQLLEEKDFLQVYFVIRENLLPIALDIWPHAQITKITDIDNPDLWVSNEIKDVLLRIDRYKDQSQRPR